MAAIPSIVSAAPAWADHGGGLDGRAANPIVTALLWAGATFLLGIALIAIVTLWSRRRSAPPPDG
jgi:hypothetical protein